jgi:Uma2 family endonuclease
LSTLALAVEVNASTPDDHTLKRVKYARAGVPAYWVVDAAGRRVVVYTGPGAAGDYAFREVCAPGQELAVVVGGHACGAVRVEEVCP